MYRFPTIGCKICMPYRKTGVQGQSGHCDSATKVTSVQNSLPVRPSFSTQMFPLETFPSCTLLDHPLPRQGTPIRFLGRKAAQLQTRNDSGLCGQTRGWIGDFAIWDPLLLCGEYHLRIFHLRNRLNVLKPTESEVSYKVFRQWWCLSTTQEEKKVVLPLNNGRQKVWPCEISRQSGSHTPTARTTQEK